MNNDNSQNPNNLDFEFELDFDLEDELGIKPYVNQESSEEEEAEEKPNPQKDDLPEDDLGTDALPSSVEKDNELDEQEEDDDDKIDNFYSKLNTTSNLHETLRDLVFEAVKSEVSGVEGQAEQQDTGFDVIQSKRKELHNMLDNLDKELEGKDFSDVAAVFSSMLDINSQLCMQKTDGVISVKARLYQFFTPPDEKVPASNSLRQEISLIFSPEEIYAIRSHMDELEDEDPLKPFFTTVLDQAYDVVQYSEMTGYLLLEMSNYFIQRLVDNGYGDSPKVGEFRERHDRAKLSLQKAIDDLRNVESLVKKHLKDRPVLLELPKLLRALIHVKLGISPKSNIPKILQEIKNRMGDYARARSAVAFDFNRVPSYQHSVRLRQSIILNLHRDILKYTGEMFEKEFRAVREEFERHMSDIEAALEEADPSSPEYQDILKKKGKMQERLEAQRRKLDVVKSQESLVDVQHQMIQAANERFKENEAMHKKLEEQIENRPKNIDTTPTNTSPTKKKPARMVMAGKRRS